MVNRNLQVTSASAGLDCQSITEDDFIVTNRDVVVFNTMDRGCPVEVHVAAVARTPNNLGRSLYLR